MNTKSTAKHFLIIFGGTFLNLLIGLLTTPIITRLVDTDQYGRLSIFNMYVGIAVMVFCLGLDQAMVRFFYREDTLEYKSTLFKTCLGLPVISWIIFAAIFLILQRNHIINFEFSKEITLILAITILFQLINRFNVLLLRLQYKSTRYSLINIIHKLSYTVIAILLILNINKDIDFQLLCIATLSASVISVIINTIWERKIWTNKQDKEQKVNIKELVIFGYPFILSMGITTLFQSIDKISLNHFCDYSEVGIYSSAMSLIQIFAVLQTSFNALWAPMATEHYQKNKEDRLFYKKGFDYITILMFFAGFCLIFGKDLFAILLGEKYRLAAYFLPCLCFNPIMYTISETTVVGINFSKKSYLHIITAVVASITNIAGNLILVPELGGRGAAISTGISYIIFFIMRTVLSGISFKVNYNFKRFILISALALIFALYNTFIKFNTITVIFFLISIIILFIIYKQEIKELWNQKDQLLKNRKKKAEPKEI